MKKYVSALEEMLDTAEENYAKESELVHKLVNELLETRNEFQRFINTTKQFSPRGSDFVLPPVRSLDVEKYFEQPLEDLD